MASKSTLPKKHAATAMTRIQFELPEAQVIELKDLMDAAGIQTRKDLLNNALMLLEWALGERRQGRIIVSLDEKNRQHREILMPILSSQRMQS
jgi:hypothetical protein